jgi:hypothetical protein
LEAPIPLLHAVPLELTALTQWSLL